MAKNSREEEILNEEVVEDEAVEEAPVAKGKKSKAYTDFANLIEAYKKQNPVKYAMKAKELASRLAKLA